MVGTKVLGMTSLEDLAYITKDWEEGHSEWIRYRKEMRWGRRPSLPVPGLRDLVRQSDRSEPAPSPRVTPRARE